MNAKDHFELFAHSATVERVIDGDSVRFKNVKCGFGIMLESINARIIGINAPEIKGEERPAGLVSKDRLEQLLPKDKEVMIISFKYKKCKYGRPLCSIYIEDNEGNFTVDVGNILLEEGLAEVYV